MSNSSFRGYPLLATFTNGGWMVFYFDTESARDELVDPNPGHPFASFVALPQDVNGQVQFPEGHPAYGLRHGQGLPPPPPSPPSAGAPSSQR